MASDGKTLVWLPYGEKKEFMGDLVLDEQFWAKKKNHMTLLAIQQNSSTVPPPPIRAPAPLKWDIGGTERYLVRVRVSPIGPGQRNFPLFSPSPHPHCDHPQFQTGPAVSQAGLNWKRGQCVPAQILAHQCLVSPFLFSLILYSRHLASAKKKAKKKRKKIALVGLKRVKLRRKTGNIKNAF